MNPWLSGLLPRVVRWMDTIVSEDRAASIFSWYSDTTQHGATTQKNMKSIPSVWRICTQSLGSLVRNPLWVRMSLCEAQGCTFTVAESVLKRNKPKDYFQAEVFWVVTPCNVVVAYQRFRGPCCLRIQGCDAM